MTDLERFHMVDEIRRVCDAQGVNYQFDGAWTRENLAWIFEKAMLQIKRESEAQPYVEERRESIQKGARRAPKRFRL
jgi:hypothetical protein